jgi:mitochondrial fission protein ELM1
MMSEAIATSAPVLVAPLPGRSRRQGEFLQGLIDAGRVRLYTGRFVHWPAAPVNDTPEAGAAVRRLLGF